MFSRSASVGVFAFLLAIAFVPGIRDAAEGPRWWVAGIGLPLLLYGQRPQLTAPAVAGLVFLAYATASLAWTPVWQDGVYRWWHWVVMAQAFALGSAIKDMRPVYRGLALGVGVNALLAASQALGWSPVDQVPTATPAGLFENRNIMGELAAVAVVAAFFAGPRWSADLPLVALLLSQCRGAGVALSAAGLCWLAWRRPVLALLAAAFCIGLGLGAIQWRPETVERRVALWQDIAENLTFAGHGIGSLYSTYPAIAKRTDALEQRPDHAHNDALETAYDLGLGGVALSLATGLLLWRARETERLVLVVVLVEGLVGFPLQMPGTGVVAALAAGAAAREWHPLRWHQLLGRGLLRHGWRRPRQHQPDPAAAGRQDLAV